MATDYELKYTPGPTYEEMADPSKFPPAVRAAALRARANELDPLNLFNITWLNEHNRPRYVVLPRELTGTKANIIPATADLHVNIRSYDDGVHDRIVAAITRICRGEAEAAGCPAEPEISSYDTVPLTDND